MPEIHPIVQAEFHSWDEGVNVAALLGGASQKLTLRFFDEDGELATIIARSAAATQALLALLTFAELFPERPIPLGSTLAQLCAALDVVSKLKRELHERAVSMVKSRLAHAVTRELPVAMENPDRRFRTAKASEIHVAVEFAKQATAAKLFLFPENDLLADGHESTVLSAP